MEYAHSITNLMDPEHGKTIEERWDWCDNLAAEQLSEQTLRQQRILNYMANGYMDMMRYAMQGKNETVVREACRLLAEHTLSAGGEIL